jgi:hypothetical protein
MTAATDAQWRRGKQRPERKGFAAVPKIHVIRDKAALINRIDAARNIIERDEYSRQLDDVDFDTWKDIDRGAKQTLPVLARCIIRRQRRTLDLIAQYVAWKWLLGHPDADTFHGAHEKPQGYDLHKTYAYLKLQIETGEWDRLTQQAIQTVKGKINAA